jgi:hypothetical protein
MIILSDLLLSLKDNVGILSLDSFAWPELNVVFWWDRLDASLNTYPLLIDKRFILYECKTIGQVNGIRKYHGQRPYFYSRQRTWATFLFVFFFPSWTF